jgi:hypothetical protein
MNALAKLSSGQVAFIRNLYSSKLFSQSQLGDVFGVGQPTIHKVVHHQRWRVVS